MPAGWASDSCFNRLIGLKNEENFGRSEAGTGLRDPKKVLGLGAREADRVLVVDAGLEAATEAVEGLKLDAEGFGRNSIAATLKPLETADVGVGIADRLGLVKPDVPMD